MARKKVVVEEKPLYVLVDGEIIVSKDNLVKIADSPEATKEIKTLKEVFGYPIKLVEPEKVEEKTKKRGFRLDTAIMYLENGGIEAKKKDIDTFKGFKKKIAQESNKYETVKAKIKDPDNKTEEENAMLKAARTTQQEAIVSIRKEAAKFFKDTFGEEAYKEVLDLSI